jgi:hypothetical protein
MPVQQLTSESVNQVINDRDTVLVDFGRLVRTVPGVRWCSRPPPSVTATSFRRLQHRGAAELAAAFEIRSIPTVMAFREGILVYAQPGALPAEAVDELLRQARALDMVEVHAKAEPAAQAAGR